nr:energy transducer TonB [Bacteroidota bacterium]
MKVQFYYLVTLFFIVACTFAMSQNNIIETIVDTDPRIIKSFTLKDLQPNQFYLAAPFAKAMLLRNPEMDKIKDFAIYKVELVYTTYKESKNFDQRELNINRLKNLKKTYPEIFENILAEWSQIAIDGATTRQEGKEMFHGFIFTYRLPPSKEKTETEIGEIEKILAGIKTKKDFEADSIMKLIKKPKKTLPVYEMPRFIGGNDLLQKYIDRKIKYPKKALMDKKQGLVKIAFKIDSRGKVVSPYLVSGIESKCNDVALDIFDKMPNWIPGKRDGKPVVYEFQIALRFDADKNKIYCDTLKFEGASKDNKGGGKYEDISEMIAKEQEEEISDWMREQDSIVFNSLIRNNFGEALLLCDVTGSMSPYTGQTLLCIKNNIAKNNIKQIVFFNDGDNMLDYEKKMGEVGGIYITDKINIDTIIQLAYTAMRNGNGGDNPENNIEAALAGTAKYPATKSIIMIADNYATPRDMELLSQLRVPVHVILCGATHFINPNYLAIARRTKGSLHTMQHDLLNLDKMQEMETIKINGETYRLVRGKFMRL